MCNCPCKSAPDLCAIPSVSNTRHHLRPTYDQMKPKQYSLMQVTTVGLHRFICMHIQNDKQHLKYIQFLKMIRSWIQIYNLKTFCDYTVIGISYHCETWLFLVIVRLRASVKGENRCFSLNNSRLAPILGVAGWWKFLPDKQFLPQSGIFKSKKKLIKQLYK